jgi:hypothetical protein
MSFTLGDPAEMIGGSAIELIESCPSTPDPPTRACKTRRNKQMITAMHAELADVKAKNITVAQSQRMRQNQHQ